MRAPLKRAIEVPAGVCACELPQADRAGTAAEGLATCDVLDLPTPQLLEVLQARFSRGGLAAAQVTTAQYVNRLNAQRGARNITQILAATAAQPKRDNTGTGMSYSVGDLESRALKSERKARQATARADAAQASGDPAAIAKAQAKLERADRKAYQRRTAAVRARHDTMAGRVPQATCDPDDVASRATATAQSEVDLTGGAGGWQPDDLGAAAIATAARAGAMLAAGGSGLRRGPDGTAVRASDLARVDAAHADALDCETGAAARLASRSRRSHMEGTRLGLTASQVRASLAADGAPRATGATAAHADALDDEDQARAAMQARGRAAASTPNPKGSRKS